MDILVTVVNQKLRIATNLQNLVSGSQDFIRFIFDLSSDWDDMTTFAQFQQSGIPYNRSLDENNAVYLPSEIRAGTCKLTLYGGGNGRTGTTNYVTLYIDENTFVYDAIPGDGIPEALGDRLSVIEESIRNLSTAVSNKYTLPATGIPYNDLSSAVQQMITNSDGSGSGEPIIVQGDTSTTYGFATQAALTSFRNDYPNALKHGDYVWVKDGDYTAHTYTLNIVNQNLQFSQIFKIGDTFVVTVSSNQDILSANKTLYQISTALSGGENVVLRTEYGVVLSPTNYDTNGIYFTTVADFDGVFYTRTYAITSNGLSVNTRNLSEGTGFKVITVNGDEGTGYEIDFQNSDFTSPSQLNQILNTDRTEDVRMKINGALLPCVYADLHSAQFSGVTSVNDSIMLVGAKWNGNDDTITTFQINTEDFALKSDSESSISSESLTDAIVGMTAEQVGYVNEALGAPPSPTANQAGYIPVVNDQGAYTLTINGAVQKTDIDTKTSEMNQPVGIDLETGKLYTASATSEQVASAAAAWLDNNITQPTTPAVDASLSVSYASADAKATGDKIKATDSALRIYNVSNLFPTKVGSTTHRYVTYTPPTQAGQTCDFSGTAGGATSVCVLIDKTDPLPTGMVAGGNYEFAYTVVTSASAKPTLVFEQYNGTTRIGNAVTYSDGDTATITLAGTCTGIKAQLQTAVGDAVSGSCTVEMLGAMTNKQLTSRVDALTDATTAVEELAANLAAINAVNLLSRGQDVTHRGVSFTWTWDDSKSLWTCAYSGTSTSGGSNCKIVGSASELPERFVAGGKYTLTFQRSTSLENNSLKFCVDQYKSGVSQPTTTTVSTDGETEITISADTIGVIIRLYVAAGDSVSGTCTMKLLGTKTNQQLSQIIETTGERVSAVERLVDTICGETLNRYSGAVILGRSYNYTSMAHRAVSSDAILIGESGVAVRIEKIPETIALKVCGYSTSTTISSMSHIGNYINQWSQAVNIAIDGTHAGEYLRFEFTSVDESTALTAADFTPDKVQIMVSDGTKAVPYTPKDSAVDNMARQHKAPQYITIATLNCGQENRANPVLIDGQTVYVTPQTVIEGGYAAMNNADADIIGLQEYSHTVLDNVSVDQVLFDKLYPFKSNESWITGVQIAIKSRHKIIDSGGGKYASGNYRYQWAALDVGRADYLCVINTHLSTNLGDRLDEWAELAGIAQNLMNRYKYLAITMDSNAGLNGGDAENEIEALTDLGLRCSNGGIYEWMPSGHIIPLELIFFTANMIPCKHDSQDATAFGADHPLKLIRFMLADDPILTQETEN